MYYPFVEQAFIPALALADAAPLRLLQGIGMP
jgi:hypothetical protein